MAKENVHPSQMDKRTREYKEWTAQEKIRAEAPAPGEAPPVIAQAIAPRETVPAKAAEDAGKKGVDKPPTRPWERALASKKPWRRDYFALQSKRPGFRPRFVAQDKVEGRLQRGYQVADPTHYGGLVDIDVRESKGLGKYISRQGMILMEIPEEGARAYERQQHEFIQSQYKKLRKDVADEAKAAGFKVEMESVGLQ
mgnify:CR=1 FL=1